MTETEIAKGTRTVPLVALVAVGTAAILGIVASAGLGVRLGAVSTDLAETHAQVDQLDSELGKVTGQLSSARGELREEQFGHANCTLALSFMRSAAGKMGEAAQKQNDVIRLLALGGPSAARPSDVEAANDDIEQATSLVRSANGAGCDE